MDLGKCYILMGESIWVNSKIICVMVKVSSGGIMGTGTRVTTFKIWDKVKVRCSFQMVIIIKAYSNAMNFMVKVYIISETEIDIKATFLWVKEPEMENWSQTMEIYTLDNSRMGKNMEKAPLRNKMEAWYTLNGKMIKFNRSIVWISKAKEFLILPLMKIGIMVNSEYFDFISIFIMK